MNSVPLSSIQSIDGLTRDALDAAPVGINIVDRNMRVVYVNRKQQSHFPDRQLVGRICYKAYMNDENRDEVCPWCAAKNAFESGKTVRRIAPSRSADGALFDHFECTATPLRDETGDIYAVMEIVVDISSGGATLSIFPDQDVEPPRLAPTFAFDKLVCAGEAMREVRQRLERIVDTYATILITGETGTGKSMIAQIIHDNSSRKPKPFVTINCTNMSETLLESQLFGHEKGAFTGATSTHKGYVESADGGTILLDEIGDLSLNMQARLLRFLETSQFERVGSTKTCEVDVRILAATNQDLEQLVHQGRFRSDLYYRVNVISLHIPPLRERREELPFLVDYFVRNYCRELEIPPKRISPRLMQVFLEYEWPGNVRQMRNEIAQMVILSRYEDELTDDSLSTGIRAAMSLDDGSQEEEERGTLREIVENVEKRVVRRALRENNSNRSRTASLLGLTRKGLLNKIKRYNLE
ncbi:MAG: sigma-54-dependent Fis family transcriptional regulator [bacterium]